VVALRDQAVHSDQICQMDRKAVSHSNCRFCDEPLEHVFADLGMSPLANAYVPPERAAAMEPFFPLRALVCSRCFLVQLEEFETPESLFSDYAYFSAYSTTWLEHSRRYAAAMIDRFGIGTSSKVIEVASNDGYLLQYFVERAIPVLGIEPAANAAAAALERNVPTEIRFFGKEVASDLRQHHAADLLIGNNVLAHVPNLNDFVAGLQVLLKPTGVITMEFPHLMRLVDEVQFDTIYHEHFSYFSFATVLRVFDAHRLVVFDVEELPTHGGSLRIYARHRDAESKPVSARVGELLAREEGAGYEQLETYLGFTERVRATKRRLLAFLVDARERGSSIAGYGAPAKGNTLLNYCGIGTDFIDYTVDRNPHKQGKLLPGTHIPIRPPEEIERTKPDLVLILPWNIRHEVVEQMAHVRDWGGQFVVPVPEPQIC
jgi:2-polyprenyl-3-methyl-5-hydroxy-6-metoxy-1,4-benzoquinol methylase